MKFIPTTLSSQDLSQDSRRNKLHFHSSSNHSDTEKNKGKSRYSFSVLCHIRIRKKPSYSFQNNLDSQLSTTFDILKPSLDHLKSLESDFWSKFLNLRTARLTCRYWWLSSLTRTLIVRTRTTSRTAFIARTVFLFIGQLPITLDKTVKITGLTTAYTFNIITW